MIETSHRLHAANSLGIPALLMQSTPMHKKYEQGFRENVKIYLLLVGILVLEFP